MILKHIDKPLLAIVVVEQGRIESRRIDVDGVRPRALDLVRMNNVIRVIFERAILALDVGVHEPELVAVVRQTGGPYTCFPPPECVMQSSKWGF